MTHDRLGRDLCKRVGADCVDPEGVCLGDGGVAARRIVYRDAGGKHEAFHATNVFHQSPGRIGVDVEGVRPRSTGCKDGAGRNGAVEHVAKLSGHSVERVEQVMGDAMDTYAFEPLSRLWVGEPRHGEHRVVTGKQAGGWRADGTLTPDEQHALSPHRSNPLRLNQDMPRWMWAQVR